jgi:hypothetical protein
MSKGSARRTRVPVLGELSEGNATTTRKVEGGSVAAEKKKSASRRLAVAALLSSLIASSLVALAAPPAFADGPKLRTYTGNGQIGGTVWFKSYGDHFYLCDELKDGYSVAVEFQWHREATNRVETDRRWNWWGPDRYGGCKDINIDAVEGTLVFYNVCLGLDAHPGGEPAYVVRNSCSATASAWA